MEKLYKLNFWFLMFILATFIIPSISGLPLTPSAAFYAPIWLLMLVLTNTKIIFSKGFFVGYIFFIFHFFYISFDFYPSDRDNTRYMLDEVIPILFSFSLLEYFQNTKRFQDLRKTTNLLFIGTLITTATSGLMLIKYPDAARLLAGALVDNESLSNYYTLIGIAGFYFYIYLALLAPLFVLIILKTENKKIKFIFYGIYFATFLTVLISQYAASISLFVITTLLTYLYLRVKTVPVYFIFLITAIFLFFNKQIISNTIIDFSNYINLENLSPRLKNIAFLIEGNESNQSIEDLRYKEDYDDLKNISLNSFDENVLTGGGKIGDHVFWYDVLGNYGILGLIPWIVFFTYTFRTRIRLFNNEFKGVFVIIFFSLIFIGFHKPIRAFLILPYITFVIPALILKTQKWSLNNKSFLKS